VPDSDNVIPRAARTDLVVCSACHNENAAELARCGFCDAPLAGAEKVEA